MDNWIGIQQSELDETSRDCLAWQTIVGLEEGDRRENQDNLLLITSNGQINYLRDGLKHSEAHSNWQEGRIRIAVMDGMGGHEGGQEISQNVAETIATMPPFDSDTALYQALDELHSQLIEYYAGRDGRAPGTTLTLLETPEYNPEGCQAWLYHMGDSRLYELAPGQQPQCLTMDHVPATKLFLGGLFDKDTWHTQVHLQNRSMITQVFGYGSSFEPLGKPEESEFSPQPFILHDDNLPEGFKHLGDRRTVDLKAGHSYVLASDGLWNVVVPQDVVNQWQQIDLKQDTATVVMQLFELLEKNKSENIRSDNVTALLLQLPSDTIDTEANDNNYTDRDDRQPSALRNFLRKWLK